MSLVEMSLSATVLIILIAILRAFLINKIPKQTFIYLWGIVILRLLIPTSWLSHLNSRRELNTNLILGTDFGGGHELLEATGIMDFLATTELRILWLAGVVISCLFFIVPHVKSLQEYKMSLPINHAFIEAWQKEFALKRQIQVRQSEFVLAPLTYGVRKPVILLPKTLDFTNEKELSYILMHEYMHIKRFDVALKWMIVITTCLHWFNPWVWLMFYFINRDIELACDDAVILSFGQKLKKSYATTLINLEEKKQSFNSFAMYFSKSAIEERVESIMKVRSYSRVNLGFSVSLVVLMLLFSSQVTIEGARRESQDFEKDHTLDVIEVMFGVDHVSEAGSRQINFEGDLSQWSFEVFVESGNDVTSVRVYVD